MTTNAAQASFEATSAKVDFSLLGGVLISKSGDDALKGE
jgi:hypothetical protein